MKCNYPSTLNHHNIKRPIPHARSSLAAVALAILLILVHGFPCRVDSALAQDREVEKETAPQMMTSAVKQQIERQNLTENTLRIGISELPLSFNPFAPRRYIDTVVTGLVYAPLVTLKFHHQDATRAYEEVLAERVSPDRRHSGVITVKLRADAYNHDEASPDRTFNHNDIRYTLDGISKLPENPFRRNEIEPYRETAPGSSTMSLKVGYPKIAAQMNDYLIPSLAFPVVPAGSFGNDYDMPIDTQAEIEKFINGFGPYTLTTYDADNKTVILERFGRYLGGKTNSRPVPGGKGPFEKVGFLYDNEPNVIISSFEEGAVHIVIDYYGADLPTDIRPDEALIDPALNSVTMLAFNFRDNHPFLPLVEEQDFRTLVASCMNKKVRNVFYNNNGDPRFLFDRPLDPREELRVDPLYKINRGKISEMVEEFFQRPGVRELKGSTIHIPYQGHKPAYGYLAGQIETQLNDSFKGYLTFKMVPVTTGGEWRMKTLEKRDFTMILYTHYFGSNRMMNNFLFFSPDEKDRFFNLTGYDRIDPMSEGGGSGGAGGDAIDYSRVYDDFIREVHNQLPVVVLGRFHRYNLIDRKHIAFPWDAPGAGPASADADFKTHPLFYDVYNWQEK